MGDVRRFVIQQHDATRLHWDLRLEHDGVLRSWALPRGVPWSPDENRLAVRTEDHPLEFLDHEGDAFDGRFGAGRSTRWDHGTFEVEKMEDEKVVVVLAGQRVSGRYALFSMRGGRDWLIHRMDPPVDDARRAVPVGVTPMRASDGELPDDATGWAFEVELRGLRVIVTDDTGRVLVHDANGDDVSMRFPEVRRIGRALGHRELILDGVIVPLDADGELRHDRAGLARRMRIGSDSGARGAARTAPVVVVAFDLLWSEGRPTTGQPWEVRRRQLDDLRLDGPGWRTSELLDVEAAWSILDDAGGASGGDGGRGGPRSVVAKRRSSPYVVGATSGDWIRTQRTAR